MGWLEALNQIFDGKKFADALVAGQVSTKVNEQLELLGPEKLDALITSDTDMRQEMTPEQIKALRQMARENAGKVVLALQHINYVLEHLPPWAIQIRHKHGAKGDEWLQRQLDWIEGLATNTPTMTIKSRW